MTFDGVVPIAYVARALWSEAEIDGDEGKIGGEDEVELKFFGKVIFVFGPGMELDFVGGFVACFDEAALHFLGPEIVGDEVVATGAGVGLHALCGRVLAGFLSEAVTRFGDAGVGGVGRVEGRGEDGVRGDMVAPGIEGHAPGIGVGVGAEGGELFGGGVVEEPGGVFGANGAVSCFGLGVVEDGFTEEEIAAGRPGEVVEGVVGVLATEAGEDDLASVHFSVAINIGKVGEVRLFGTIDAAVAIEHE